MALNPSVLTYADWLNVGMALQHSGCSHGDWEAWSKLDRARYKDGECERKWNGFKGHTPPVTLGTLIEITRQHGDLPSDLWDFSENSPPDTTWGWDDAIPSVRHHEPNAQWVASEEIPAPASDWAPMDLVRYLNAMFQPEDLVGLCVETYKPEEPDARWLPKKGVWDRTSGQLVELIHKCKGDLGAVIGDTNKEAGAWIRINPLDGKGVADVNVTSYRHALLEADDGDLGKQLALIKEMQLPVSAIVHSGKKSIHALVRVEAKDLPEYRARVDYLFKVAERYGLKVDTGNRNPSRLSRLPGVLRDGHPQYLISGPTGLADWDAWYNHVEDIKDDLPDPEPLSTTFFDMPDLAPVLIDGILRTGHKLAVTGPSKAGKSFALIELAVSIAEGRDWLGMGCRQGPVLYVDLELDRVSCLHRFKDVYEAHGWAPENVKNIDVWSLRGKSVPLDKLAPKLIRRAMKRGYIAIIIDPIYKVLTGDENSAEDMAKFCNQFDRIALGIGCAVIYVHHHSKGDQGGKRAIDRASGSGVFGRDPDAVLDLIELNLSKERRAELVNKIVRRELDAFIPTIDHDGFNRVEEDSRAPADAYLMAAQMAYPKQAAALANARYEATKKANNMTAWRIDATLREFAPAESRRIWFGWPIHFGDEWALLTDVKAAGEEPPWVAQQKAKDEAQKSKSVQMKTELEAAIEACGGVGEATVKAVAEELCLSDDATRVRVKKHGKYKSKNGVILSQKKRGG